MNQRQAMYDKYDRLLKEHNVSTYRLCADKEIDNARISDWKRGKCTPKADIIAKICDYFDVPITYFYGD